MSREIVRYRSTSVKGASRSAKLLVGVDDAGSLGLGDVGAAEFGPDDAALRRGGTIDESVDPVERSRLGDVGAG
jgi:hypothetical protein